MEPMQSSPANGAHSPNVDYIPHKWPQSPRLTPSHLLVPAGGQVSTCVQVGAACSLLFGEYIVVRGPEQQPYQH